MGDAEVSVSLEVVSSKVLEGDVLLKVKKLGKEDLVIKPPEIHAVRFPCLHYALHFMQKEEASQLHLKNEVTK